MKIKFLGIVITSCVSAVVLLSSLRTKDIDSEDLIGAWGYGPQDNRTVMINTDKIFAVANYDLPGKKFISSYGGTWRVEGNQFIRKIEWNSKDSAQVGEETT